MDFAPSFIIIQSRFKVPAGQNSCMLLPINRYLAYEARFTVKHTHATLFPSNFKWIRVHTTE